MEFTTFYATVAQLCFTVLGLWVLVLQTKHRDWSVNPAHRRLAANISLYFLLPGCMSLLALLAARASLLWQTSFVVASVLGIVETGLLVRGGWEIAAEEAQAHISVSPITRALRWLGIVFYALVALVALFADVIRPRVPPLSVSGVLITLLVVLGLLLAWTYFAEPLPSE